MTLNPNLDDVREGRIELSVILERDSEEPFLNWNEIRAMHRSGMIDFQSHTSWHNSVYVSGRIVEFANPSFNISFLKGVPQSSCPPRGQGWSPEGVDWGSPIYEWGPAWDPEEIHRG